MRQLSFTAGELVDRLLALPANYKLCVLDSCGKTDLGSHLLIAGIFPVERYEISQPDSVSSLEILDQILESTDHAALMSISYDFGLKLNQLSTRHKRTNEPDVFISLYPALIVHDYNDGHTFLVGDETYFDQIEAALDSSVTSVPAPSYCESSFDPEMNEARYIGLVSDIQEMIRAGVTYQTNLTQRIEITGGAVESPELIFQRLRIVHPTAFAAFLRRENDIVVSASPERFFKIHRGRIETSPIKGTRRRGANKAEDEQLLKELSESAKDRAENIMIVDLLRNDLGRICRFGSVNADKLCEIEEHTTLFHMVSTISGHLKPDLRFSDVLLALFPCGSITGAPKISTMKLIDQLELSSRGLSMGAVGMMIPDSFGIISEDKSPERKGDGNVFERKYFDFSVAIRTLVIRNGRAAFNVGGGVVIDSDPADEYQESLLKAAALLNAVGTNDSP